MPLTPVAANRAPSLRDADARLRSGIPDRETLRDEADAHAARIGELQEMLYASGRYSLLIVLQGRDASGKDSTIKNVFDAVNPQGCRVTSYKAPTPMELAHDYLWRIHHQVPERGMIGIFNRSHYEDVLVPRVKKLVPKAVWSARYAQINEFERMLSLNNVVILKFFLHISRDEQKERLEERLSDPTKNWKFNPKDLEARGQWSVYNAAYREMLARCSTRWAPWYVVPSDEKRIRNWLISPIIIRALERLRLRYPRIAPDVARIQIP